MNDLDKREKINKKRRILLILIFICFACIIGIFAANIIASNNIDMKGALGKSSGSGENSGSIADANDGENSGAITDANANANSGSIAGKNSGAADTEDEQSSETITLAFAGDINFDDSWVNMQHYHAIDDDLDAVIDPVFQDTLKQADLAWINNEFTYSIRGRALDGKAYTFRTDPKNVSILNTLGIDIAGLANNHIFDYGADAFSDTLSTLQNAGIEYVGAGMNSDEAFAPKYMTVKDLTIGFVAASRAEKIRYTPEATADSPGIMLCYDNTHIDASIEKADANSDFVVVLPHWGDEYSNNANDIQKNDAAEYIEKGADVVIGAHPHVLQGLDVIDGKYVDYSLGNFWFNEKTLDTEICELEITYEKTALLENAAGANSFKKNDAGMSASDKSSSGKSASTSDEDITSVKMKIIPGQQKNCETRALTDESEKRALFDRLESYSDGITIDDEGYVLMP